MLWSNASIMTKRNEHEESLVRARTKAWVKRKLSQGESLEHCNDNRVAHLPRLAPERVQS